MGYNIVCFPILQILIAYGLFRESLWTMFLASGALVMTMAFLLWHFIEKPFPRKSSRNVVVNHG
jgi:peptidoglycan/LPS O-acetylase OafA/YrhL